MKRLILVLVLLFFAAPLSAQPPADFHAWFLEAVAGRSYSQDTLVALQPELACVGSQLTPPNHDGDRTKIWDPNAQLWVRVLGVEPAWPWMYQGRIAPPPPVSCAGAPTPDPTDPKPQPTLIDYERIRVIVQAEVHAEVGARPGDSVYQQNERTQADQSKQHKAIADQVTGVQADIKSLRERFVDTIGNVAEFAGKYLAPPIAAWIAAKKIGN